MFFGFCCLFVFVLSERPLRCLLRSKARPRGSSAARVAAMRWVIRSREILGCSCPPPPVSHTPPGRPANEQSKNKETEFQNRAKQKRRGPRLRNKSVKHVGLRPRIGFTFFWRNLGSRTPSGHNCWSNTKILLSFALYLGMDYYKHPCPPGRGKGDRRLRVGG